MCGGGSGTVAVGRASGCGQRSFSSCVSLPSSRPSEATTSVDHTDRSGGLLHDVQKSGAWSLQK
jgi:hypothetical protein